MSDKVTRRSVLAGGSAALGAGLAWHRRVAGEEVGRDTRATSAPKLGANDTFRVGLIGCGARGPYLGYVFHDQPQVEVAAVCDVHRGRAEEAGKLIERLGGRPTICHDYRRILDEQRLDAVVIATNIHWHALPAVQACAAGKDIYLEKPVAFCVSEGQAIIRAALHHKRIIQMGTQQHSWDHYREAVEIIRSGQLGEISHVQVWDARNMFPGLGSPPDSEPPPELDWDFWLGPAPQRPYNVNRYEHHDWFFDYSGGWQLAWGVHHLDIVHWAMGVKAPTSVEGVGGVLGLADDNREWPDTFQGTCEYPPGPVARKGFLLTYTCHTGCGPLIEAHPHGKAFYGTDGILVLSRNGFDVYPQTRDGKLTIPERKVPKGRSEHETVIDHVLGFVECCRTRRKPEADIVTGHLASNPGHLMNIAWRLGRRVRWDAGNERMIDDREANAMLSREYRPPWVLPA
jgi:predicted dehydrogenase